MKTSLVAILLGVGLVACGGGEKSNTLPTPPPYVSVAGNYSGTLTQTGGGQSFVCPATTTVIQSADRVNFTGLVLAAPCPPQTIALNSVIIDTNGRIPSYPQTLGFALACGDYILVMDGGFSGNQLRLSYAYTAQTKACPSFSQIMVLTR